MVGEIARDPECAGLPISGIGGIEAWRDAAEYMAMGAANVQVCTAAMVYGFKIVESMIDGLNNWMDSKGYRTVPDFVGKAVPNFVNWEYLNLQYVAKARHRPGPLHQVRPLLHCLRGHVAPGHLEGKERQAPLRGDRQGMRRLQPVRERLSGRGLPDPA